MMAKKEKIMVVDDEPSIRKYLQTLLEVDGFEVEALASGKEALARIGEGERPLFIILDVLMSEMDGLETLRRLMQVDRKLNVIMLSCSNEVTTVVEAIRLGALDYLTKPFEKPELDAAFLKCRQKQQLRSENEALRETCEAITEDISFLAASPQMLKIRQQVLQLAPVDVPVFISGESGVGKEVIANTIHARSRRAEQSMVKLNCAAFPQTMIEGELFGYVKGAFTGATHDFPGMIAAAEGGTLFLDEISDMPADLQTRFLRVLQEREYRPLGSTKTMKANFRAIAATNRPIPEALAENRLRSDLYYRLNTFQIEVPPLRKRREDIPPLIAQFVRQFSQQLGKPEPDVSPDAFQKLLDYAWPGNVRELQNAIEYAVVLAREGVIGVKELPAEVQLPPALQQAELGGLPRKGVQTLDDMERNAILQALAECRGNKKKAAELLGIQRPTLYNKLKRYAIEL